MPRLLFTERENSLVNCLYILFANFYLTQLFGFSLCTTSNWQTAHARMGGVEPLNLEEN